MVSSNVCAIIIVCLYMIVTVAELMKCLIMFKELNGGLCEGIQSNILGYSW